MCKVAQGTQCLTGTAPLLPRLSLPGRMALWETLQPGKAMCLQKRTSSVHVNVLLGTSGCHCSTWSVASWCSLAGGGRGGGQLYGLAGDSLLY
jgi:hypothetical protein